jgi:hypothetical protein
MPFGMVCPAYSIVAHKEDFVRLFAIGVYWDDGEKPAKQMAGKK